MDFGFFEYSCNFWDTEEEKMKTVHGVVYAKTFGDAVYELEQYYDYIESLKLQGIEPSNVYEFEEGTVGFSLTVNEKGEICNG